MPTRLATYTHTHTSTPTTHIACNYHAEELWKESCSGEFRSKDKDRYTQDIKKVKRGMRMNKNVAKTNGAARIKGT